MIVNNDRIYLKINVRVHVISSIAEKINGAMLNLLQMTVFIKIDGKLVEGSFIERLTRFSALVELEDEIFEVFVPNPGRLRELLNFGTKVV